MWGSAVFRRQKHVNSVIKRKIKKSTVLLLFVHCFFVLCLLLFIVIFFTEWAYSVKSCKDFDFLITKTFLFFHFFFFFLFSSLFFCIFCFYFSFLFCFIFSVFSFAHVAAFLFWCSFGLTVFSFHVFVSFSLPEIKSNRFRTFFFWKWFFCSFFLIYFCSFFFDNIFAFFLIIFLSNIKR
jgi:hypothetical protein